MKPRIVGSRFTLNRSPSCSRSTNMRLTAIDLLIVILLLNLGTGPSLLLARIYPNAIFFGLPLGIVLVLWGGSWIYRRFGFMPMYLPRCPHCSEQERFVPADRHGARSRMVCGSCRGAFVYWTSAPPPEYRPGPLAEVQVRFPYLFGPTKLTWAGAESLARQPELTGQSYSLELRLKKGSFPVTRIANRLLEPGFKKMQTADGISVATPTIRVFLREKDIDFEVDETDCAVANAVTTLQVRVWLEGLLRDYGPIRVRLEDEWRDLGQFLMFGG